VSNLPQRRKSAEEIAKLRESIGVPGAEQADSPSQPVAPAVTASRPVAETAVFHPGSQHQATPASAYSPPPIPVMAPEAASAPVAPPVPKVVKSLRRSERVPIIPRVPTSAPDSFLPVHRHSNAEIHHMDQIQVTPPDRAVTYLRSLGAHPLTIVCLYVFPLLTALFGWGTPWLIDFDDAYFSAEWMSKLSNLPHLDIAGKVLTLISALAGLGLSLRIALKKPRSRHHAGFAAIAIIVIICFIFLT
jgi:hypothetical protein